MSSGCARFNDIDIAEQKGKSDITLNLQGTVLLSKKHQHEALKTKEAPGTVYCFSQLHQCLQWSFLRFFDELN